MLVESDCMCSLSVGQSGAVSSNERSDASVVALAILLALGLCVIIALTLIVVILVVMLKRRQTFSKCMLN